MGGGMTSLNWLSPNWKNELPDELARRISSKLRKCGRPPQIEGNEYPAKYYGYGIHTPWAVGCDILNFLGKRKDTSMPDIIKMIESKEPIEGEEDQITELATQILERHREKFVGMFLNGATVTTLRPVYPVLCRGYKTSSWGSSKTHDAIHKEKTYSNNCKHCGENAKWMKNMINETGKVSYGRTTWDHTATVISRYEHPNWTKAKAENGKTFYYKTEDINKKSSKKLSPPGKGQYPKSATWVRPNDDDEDSHFYVLKCIPSCKTCKWIYESTDQWTRTRDYSRQTDTFVMRWNFIEPEPRSP